MKFTSFLPFLSGQDILNSGATRSTCEQGAVISLSETWQVLGPFQIGTREATWGADPLARYGGFPKLQYDPVATYPSSLAPNATIQWSTFDVTSRSCNSNQAIATINLAFPDVDWSFMQSIYGWAALQYQAWARGALLIGGDSPQTVVLYTERLLEFYVDGVHHFGGDYYGYHQVPLVLHLQPGSHTLEIRLVRDVRSMGGIGRPTVDVELTAQISTEDLVRSKDALLPDMVEGRLAGALGSVTVRNDGLEDSYVTGVSINDTAYFAWLAQPTSVRVVPGQTRPIAFVISCDADCSPFLRIDIEYAQTGPGPSVLSVATTINHRRVNEPHKITFLNPGGMVSYAILRPPQKDASCPTGPDHMLPIMLQLHGAGVDVDNDIVRHALDPVPDLCAWGLYPTGSTAWSGDDWHTWGFADVEAAIEAVPIWLDLVNWEGPGVDTGRWFVVGHSNGGQGTWYTMTHRPDNVFAAAPISGYSSIQNYVPYDMWRPMDPVVRALLDSSLNNFRHEQLLKNAQDIPVLQQHGSLDDNVPAYHSRLMSQLLRETGAESAYVELEGRNHWFDGVLTTDALINFYRRHLNGIKSSINPPASFSLVVANPADTGPKHGISVLQIRQHGQLGRLDVSFSQSGPLCIIRTSNVLSIRVAAIYPRTHQLVVDGHKIHTPAESGDLELWLSSDGSWKITSPAKSPATRRGRQLGAMDAVLRTGSGIQLARSARNPTIDRITLQISRNLCQYFGADTEIVDSSSNYAPEYSTLVRVAMGRNVPNSIDHFPLSITGTGEVTVRKTDGLTQFYEPMAGLGAIFLRPLKTDQVELVVWGIDEEGLQVAARLFPMLTGVGQPDFVIADTKMLWGGAGEVLAMGRFDHMWNVTAESYFT